MTPRLALAIIILLPSTAFAEPTPVEPAPPAATFAEPAPAKPTPSTPRAAPPPPRPIAEPATRDAIRAPSFELLDRGDTVEIIARNVKAARTAVIPLRSRLQVSLAGAPSARRVLPGDATVKLIELGTEDATRMLSVKLGFDPTEVKALSRFAQAIQVGDDLHLLVPRKLPPDGIARLPDPTLPLELAATVAQLNAKAVTSEPPAAPATAVASATGTAAIAGDPGAARAAGAHAPNTNEPAARSSSDARPLSHALASDTDDAWSKISMYAALGMALAGAGIWLLRRRRASLPPPATIEILAQRSLGGRARIVWLSAGPREMIVSVTPQQVRMLGQWRKAETAAALPGAYTHSDAQPPARGDAERAGDPDLPRPVDRPLSPAVTGILRLRARTGQMAAVADDSGSGDVVADERWAQEILAATGARR